MIMEEGFQKGVGILYWLLINGGAVVLAFIIVMASLGPGWPKWSNVQLGWARTKWFLDYQRRAIKRARKRWPQARLELRLVTRKKKQEIALVLLFEVAACIGLPIFLTWFIGPSPSSFFTHIYMPGLFLLADLVFLLRFLAGDEDEDGDRPPRPAGLGPTGRAVGRPQVLLRVQTTSKVKVASRKAVQ